MKTTFIGHLRKYSGVCSTSKKTVKGYYKCIFGKDAIFIPGEGIFYIEPSTLKLI